MGNAILISVLALCIGTIGCIVYDRIKKRFGKDEGFPDSRGRK